MARRRKLRLKDLFGILKDKASLSKAALLSQPNTSSLRLAIIRATTHGPSTPPHENQIETILSFGYGSRITASTCIEALMDRLHKTHNSFVAFKCLITVHCIIKRGSFILQDQLSIYPNTGGRNYLNLSNFRDNSSPESWELSGLVRWYARFLEVVLSTVRVLGSFVLCSATETEKEEEKVYALLNPDILKEIEALVSVVEEICRRPELLNLVENKLVYEVMDLVEQDYKSAAKGVLIRLKELNDRLGSLNFGDSVELACLLKRLENCREKVCSLFVNKKGAIADLVWGLIGEMKEKIAEKNANEGGGEERRLVKREKVSESARFGHRFLRPGDSVLFSSTRFELGRIPLTIIATDAR